MRSKIGIAMPRNRKTNAKKQTDAWVSHTRKVNNKNLDSWEWQATTHRSKIKTYSEEDNPRAAAAISNRCTSLAGVWGIPGKVSILNGDNTGWAQVDLAISLQAWSVIFDLGSLTNAARRNELAEWVLLTFGTADMASSLCHAYQANLHGWHKGLSDAWRSLVDTPEIHSKGTDWWQSGTHGEMHFECFCLRMFREGVMSPAWKLPAAIENRNLGPFQGIVDGWTDSGRIAEALHQALDYHCDNFTDDGPGTPWAPFQHAPFDLVPVWYFAILKRRREEGLETPEISHPLLDLPTAKPGNYVWGSATDSILEELAAYYKKFELPPWIPEG